MILSLIVSVFALNASSAALPPGAESLRRLKAIAESPDVFKAIGSARWVDRIEQSEHGYLVHADDCVLEVQVEPVKAEPMPMVPKLKVIVGKLECKPRH